MTDVIRLEISGGGRSLHILHVEDKEESNVGKTVAGELFGIRLRVLLYRLLNSTKKVLVINYNIS